VRDGRRCFVVVDCGHDWPVRGFTHGSMIPFSLILMFSCRDKRAVARQAGSAI
jgi:hypothetical protein